MGQQRVLVVIMASLGLTLLAIAFAQLRQTRVSSASSLPAPKPKPVQPQPIRFPNLTELFPTTRLENLPSLEEPIDEIPLPEANWRLDIPSQTDTAANHQRLMQGNVPVDSRGSRPPIPQNFSLPPLPSTVPLSTSKPKQFPSEQRMTEETGPAGVMKPLTNPISTDALNNANPQPDLYLNSAETRPRLNLKPIQPEQETFQPHLPTLTKPPQDQSQSPSSTSIATPTAEGK